MNSKTISDDKETDDDHRDERRALRRVGRYVRLMGQVRLAGRMTEQQVAGGHFLRLDIHKEEGPAVITQLIPPPPAWPGVPDHDHDGGCGPEDRRPVECRSRWPAWELERGQAGHRVGRRQVLTITTRWGRSE